MAILKKYNLAGKEVGEVALEEGLISADASSQMIKDYLIALRANARQWSANTKGRTEVNHTGKKPHPQKGTGRARQGCLAAPQYKGGGRVFGPKPKFDQHVRINRKERRAAMRHLLSEKILSNNVRLLQLDAMKAPKTKTVANFLENCGLTGKSVLFLGDVANPSYDNFLKSMQNIQRLDFLLVSNVGGYDVAASQNIIVLEPALDQLKQFLKG